MTGRLHYIQVDLDDATEDDCGLWFTVAYGLMITQLEDRLAAEAVMDGYDG